MANDQNRLSGSRPPSASPANKPRPAAAPTPAATPPRPPAAKPAVASPYSTSPCSGCGMPLADDAVICVNCGFKRGGQQLATKKGVEKAPKPKKVRDRSDYSAGKEWGKAIGMLVAGFALMLLSSAMWGDMEHVVGDLIYWAIRLPVMWLVVAVCILTFAGYGGSPFIAAAYVAGAIAVGDGVVGFMPNTFLFLKFALLVWCITVGGLLYEAMNWDLQEGIFVAVLMAVANIGLWVTLAVYEIGPGS